MPFPQHRQIWSGLGRRLGSDRCRKAPPHGTYLCSPCLLQGTCHNGVTAKWLLSNNVLRSPTSNYKTCILSENAQAICPAGCLQSSLRLTDPPCTPSDQGRDLNIVKTQEGPNSLVEIDDEGTFEGVEISADGLTMALGCEAANSVAMFILPPP